MAEYLQGKKFIPEDVLRGIQDEVLALLEYSEEQPTADFDIPILAPIEVKGDNRCLKPGCFALKRCSADIFCFVHTHFPEW